MVWVNQPLVLFHGTLDIHAASVLAGVKVHLGRLYTDFGRGFYTTTVERQARSWGWQLSLRNPGAAPAVIRFEVDRNRLSRLQALWFVRGRPNARDFWSLVFHCRRGAMDHSKTAHGGLYDVVIGPVSGPWYRRRTLFDMDQISFHTAKAARVLDGSIKGQIQ